MRLADVDVQLVHQTEKAYLVKSVDTGREDWVPKARCELELKRDSNMGVLTLDENLATEKGLV